MMKLVRAIWGRQSRRARGTSRAGGQRGQAVSPHLEVNLARLRELFGASGDLAVRYFRPGLAPEVPAAVVYIDGLVDTALLDRHVLEPLLRSERGRAGLLRGAGAALASYASERLVSAAEVELVTALEEASCQLLAGRAVVFWQGSTAALAVTVRGWAARAVEEPGTESVIRGSREGFTEDLRTNLALLRRRIRSPGLRVEYLTLGRRTNTQVAVVYVDAVASPSTVAEVKRRISGIDIDSVLESGYIEQYIEDSPWSPFATVANSEKPDVVAAKLLEGRVAILVDGTPFVLLVPYLFIESLQSAEDYYSRPFYVSMLRLIRLAAFGVSVLLPALYVAAVSFHQELIPASLAITVAATREGTPFPAIIEALGMGVVFEILREAGVRLPRPIGQAVSIVGALVIGQAAVSAGLIGSLMVIVVALTGVATFVVPAQIDAGIVLRAVYTVLAGVFGLYGIVLGLVVTVAHAAVLTSFGAPYLSPVAPFSRTGAGDTIVRVPLWTMRLRPEALRSPDRVRRRGRVRVGVQPMRGRRET